MDRFLKPTFEKIEVENKNENVSTFKLEKLERGFANTIGNALRRTIISSVPGASMYAVEIKGISHEYQSIKDTKQDVVELILNLKELLLEVDHNVMNKDESYQLQLVSKTGVVTAGDIVCPEGIKIANKDLFLADSLKDGAIDMIIYVTYSKGFKTFEETRKLVDDLIGNKNGIISTDASFSPIRKVNTTISEVNPGEAYIYERLTIEVETKGNVDANWAISYAASVLKNYFIAFEELSSASANEDFIEEEVEEQEDTTLTRSIEELNLSTRSNNALEQANILSIGDLIDLSLSDLKKVDNLGEKSVMEIIDAIQEMGLSFKTE